MSNVDPRVCSPQRASTVADTLFSQLGYNCNCTLKKTWKNIMTYNNSQTHINVHMHSQAHIISLICSPTPNYKYVYII